MYFVKVNKNSRKVYNAENTLSTIIDFQLEMM